MEPLVDIDNERMPLRSRLLAVPELRERYLEYVKAIATNSLDWQELGPVVDGYRGLISPVVKQDTRMSNSFEAFNQATRSDRIDEQPMSLHKFAVERRKFLLDPKGEEVEGGRAREAQRQQKHHHIGVFYLCASTASSGGSLCQFTRDTIIHSFVQHLLPAAANEC